MNTDISSNQVANLFRRILGCGVEAKDISQPTAFPADTTVAAVYCNSEGKIAAVCLTELALAAFSGAALSLVPAPVALSNAKSGKLDPLLFENFKEILNISIQLFKALDDVRIVLQDVCLMSELPTSEAQTFISTTARKLHFNLSISGYGDGKMAIFS